MISHYDNSMFCRTQLPANLSLYSCHSSWKEDLQCLNLIRSISSYSSKQDEMIYHVSGQRREEKSFLSLARADRVRVQRLAQHKNRPARLSPPSQDVSQGTAVESLLLSSGHPVKTYFMKSFNLFIINCVLAFQIVVRRGGFILLRINSKIQNLCMDRVRMSGIIL